MHDGKDASTLDFYASEAEAYASRGQEASRARLQSFMSALPPGGRVLELGCGAGQDSEALLALGFDVAPTDGSPELAAQAERRLGRPVAVLLFEDLAEHEAFDGVWANACLLHVPRAALPGVIARVHAALKPGGIFYASYKAGEQDGRDRFGRYFNYPSPEWLRGTYGAGRWSRLDIDEKTGSGYDRELTDWLHATAFKMP